MKNANDLINRLMEYYGVYTLTELSKKLDIGQPTVTKWKKNNSINAIKKRCRELGIYDEIFKDFDKNTLTFGIDNIQKTLNIIESLIKSNNELEDKFHNILKNFIKDNI